MTIVPKDKPSESRRSPSLQEGAKVYRSRWTTTCSSPHLPSRVTTGYLSSFGRRSSRFPTAGGSGGGGEGGSAAKTSCTYESKDVLHRIASWNEITQSSLQSLPASSNRVSTRFMISPLAAKAALRPAGTVVGSVPQWKWNGLSVLQFEFTVMLMFAKSPTLSSPCIPASTHSDAVQTSRHLSAKGPSNTLSGKVMQSP